MESEISVLQVEKRIRTRVKRQMEKTQREYYLNEQMKAIQKELGDEDGKDDLAELEERIKKTKLSKEARDKASAELKKLRQMSPMSAEATVVRNYLDWLLSIPWNKRSKVKKDLASAQEVLDADHFGLDKVKERIVEYLAVQSRANKLTGPILCLVGPPGVGKTSLGKSIARATGREFVRMSLGGVRDEAEIRGHRRTYIGSMPGKIIQSMRKAKTSNPLFLLDEIDKMGMDFRGDPSSALLEVLDPEQNSTFNDHYLEVDYDLSNVMFVTTANTLNIPPALMDRMEIIRIAGYTEDEKVEIARSHLIPNAVKKHGLTDKEWAIEDGALLTIIRRYTREAGVRNLERELSNLARKAVKELLLAKKTKQRVLVTDENLSDYLGVPKFRYGEAEDEDQVGVVTGLAWTEVGGELLTIEGVMMPGKGKMTVTGNLKDVMKESISAAASYVRSRAIDFGIEPPLFERRDIHVHVPEGATPKDGPSAGTAMVTAIVSVLTGIPVRRDIAMTGEITLRGRILPIGGLKEKLLAALRGGLKKVLIPEENAKDLVDIPASVKNQLEIVPVSRMGEVLQHALVRQPEPIKWEEDTSAVVAPPAALATSEETGVIAH
jgi:ATP-dependent Lon protease